MQARAYFPVNPVFPRLPGDHTLLPPTPWGAPVHLAGPSPLGLANAMVPRAQEWLCVSSPLPAGWSSGPKASTPVSIIMTPKSLSPASGLNSSWLLDIATRMPKGRRECGFKSGQGQGPGDSRRGQEFPGALSKAEERVGEWLEGSRGPGSLIHLGFDPSTPAGWWGGLGSTGTREEPASRV